VRFPARGAQLWSAAARRNRAGRGPPVDDAVSYRLAARRNRVSQDPARGRSDERGALRRRFAPAQRAFHKGDQMTHRALGIRGGLCAAVLMCASCAPAWVPVVGKSPDVQTQAVRSIKRVRIRRIAVMPPIDAPTPGSAVAEGASDSITAELQAKMSIDAGW